MSEEEVGFAGMVVTAAPTLLATVITNLVYDWVFIMCVRRKPKPDFGRFPLWLTETTNQLLLIMAVPADAIGLPHLLQRRRQERLVRSYGLE